MKLFSLLFCSLMTFIVSAQPPKGCDEILITGVSMQELFEKLLDHHFLIDKKDTDLGTIKTERRDINYEKQKGGFIVINLRVKDSTAYIHATCGLDMTFTNNGILEYRVENKGMKGSIIKDAFEVMNQLALSFSKPITYNKTR